MNNTSKCCSFNLHSICQEHGLCAVTLKTLSIGKQESAFEGSSYTSLAQLSAALQNGLSGTLCLLQSFICCSPSWLLISV